MLNWKPSKNSLLFTFLRPKQALIEASNRAITNVTVHCHQGRLPVYHPFEEGQYWPESHYPEVKIFRGEKEIKITLFLTPLLHKKFQGDIRRSWIYIWRTEGQYIAYPFSNFLIDGEINSAEIRALNRLLNFCRDYGAEGEETTDVLSAQLALVGAENPEEFGMGAYGLWANFSAPVTKVLMELSRASALEEYVGSRMRGSYKVLLPQMRLSRPDNWVRLYRGGNPLPIFQTFGNCACLSVTSNALEPGGGFRLSPHNIDSHVQQFLILVGTLVFWQRMRLLIQKTV